MPTRHGLAFAFLFTAWLAWRFDGSRIAAFTAAIVIAGVVLKGQVIQPIFKAKHEPRTAAILEQVRPDLPLVSDVAFKDSMYAPKEKPAGFSPGGRTYID